MVVEICRYLMQFGHLLESESRETDRNQKKQQKTHQEPIEDAQVIELLEQKLYYFHVLALPLPQ